mgnify:CR=1 FL=1
MIYRKLGNTGFNISALGLGAMRLPEYEKEGKWYMDEDECIDIIHHAFKKGINYIDTAWPYSHENNQYIVGKAIKGYKDKVKVSTKVPMWNVEREDDFWYYLEEQLRRLDVDCIDFFHLHSLDNGSFENKVLKLNVLENMEKAKQKGLIAHKCFSFHDKPEIMKKIIDTGAFETVLCQYNLLDRSNEDAIEYARSKGLGIIVMGPVAGGRLAAPSDTLKKLLPNAKDTPEIALRFVLGNKNVSCALSGMTSKAMVDENVETAARCNEELSSEEWKKISDTLEQIKELSRLYCTGCDYCQPCPMGIQISKIFLLYNFHKVYGLTQYAKEEFAKLLSEAEGDPQSCIQCGECAKKCPQSIPVPEKLKQAAALLKTIQH